MSSQAEDVPARRPISPLQAFAFGVWLVGLWTEVALLTDPVAWSSIVGVALLSLLGFLIPFAFRGPRWQRVKEVRDGSEDA